MVAKTEVVYRKNQHGVWGMVRPCSLLLFKANILRVSSPRDQDWSPLIPTDFSAQNFLTTSSFPPKISLNSQGHPRLLPWPCSSRGALLWIWPSRARPLSHLGPLSHVFLYPRMVSLDPGTQQTFSWQVSQDFPSLWKPLYLQLKF